MLWSIRSFIPMPCLYSDEHVDHWATSPRLGRVIGALAEVTMRNNCVKFRIMPIKSLRPDLNVREGNILDWLSPVGSELPDKPLWLDAENGSVSLSPRQLIPRAKRIGFGLQRLGLKPRDTLLIFTPNHIFVPVSYLGTLCVGVAFPGKHRVYC